MDLKKIIFPTQSRYLPFHRWINIGLRTLHLVGLAGVGAGILYPVSAPMGFDYMALTLLSGALLSLLFIWSNGIWFVQLRGQVVLLKLVLLGMMGLWPSAAVPLLISVIVLSGWISHAPANVRYYSVYHRRRVESL